MCLAPMHSCTWPHRLLLAWPTWRLEALSTGDDDSGDDVDDIFTPVSL